MPKPDLSPEAYEMLRRALNLARNHGIRTVAQLRARMQSAWPARTEEIDQAIAYWAASTVERHPDGIPE